MLTMYIKSQLMEKLGSKFEEKMVRQACFVYGVKFKSGFKAVGNELVETAKSLTPKVTMQADKVVDLIVAEVK